MKLTWSTLATTFVAMSVVNAHFEVTFPGVRGTFNEDNEPQFCGGYTEPANRNRFPLTDGVIVWDGSHAEWTIGVLISTAASPTSFDDFHTSSGADQLVVSYFQGTGTSGCVRVEAGAAGIPGVQNGSNVTLQMAFDGGDGTLYQCMDLTLDDQYRIPTDVRCANPQGEPPTSSGAGSPSSTQSGSTSGPSSVTPSPTSTGSPSAGGAVSITVSGFLGLSLVGVLAGILA